MLSGMASTIYIYAILACSATLHPVTAQGLGFGAYQGLGNLQGDGTENKVAIGFNTYLNETERKMPLGANSFLDLISKNVFVDKTLLIRNLLTKIFGRIILTCPRKWGKTINLDMLKTFLSMPVHPNGTRILPVSDTPNYRLFVEGEYHSDQVNVKLQKPLLIANEEFKQTVKDHLGQYPVIYLSFATVKETVDKTFSIAKLSSIIAKAFQEHEYMVTMYNDIITGRSGNNTYERKRADVNKKQFVAYLKGTQKNLENSIEFLGKELYDHFEKPVFILIDEYDRILDIKDRDKKINTFFSNTLKYNQHLKSVILTGTLPKELDVDDVMLNEFLDTPYHHFYGFDSAEMDLLYVFFDIPVEDRKHIEYWYGGFEVFGNVKEKLYYPWSICNYLNFRQLKPYLEPNYGDKNLNATFDLPHFQYTYSRLMTGKDYDVEYLLFADQEWNMFEVVKNIRPCLRYLNAAGYLIATKSYFHPSSSIRRYRIPNYEMTVNLKTIFAEKLNKHYHSHILKTIEVTSAAWERFVLKDEMPLVEFHERMQRCFELFNMFSYLPLREVLAMIHTVVISTTPSKEFNFINWKYENTTKDQMQDFTIPPDVIVMTSKTRGVIVDLQSFENVSLVENHTAKYISMFREYPALHHWKDIKFVFINWKGNMTLEINSALYPLQDQ